MVWFLFLLALNCMAASPVQLTGSSGKAVLNSLGFNNSSQAAEALAGNASNLTGNNSLEDLLGDRYARAIWAGTSTILIRAISFGPLPLLQKYILCLVILFRSDLSNIR